MASAAIRSAWPSAWVTQASTISPWRFSIRAWPMKQSLASVTPGRWCWRGSHSSALALEVDFGIASLGRILLTGITAIFGLKALHRGPGLDQGAVDREVFVREQPAHAGKRQNGG